MRNPRRLLEATAEEWKRWDAAARREGISWAQFARRALLARLAYQDEVREEIATGSEAGRHLAVLLPGMSEKGAPAMPSKKQSKAPSATRAGKGSSRS
jgi:hypothetical protein